MRKNDPIKRQYIVLAIFIGFEVLGMIMITLSSIMVGRNPFQSISTLFFLFAIVCFLYATLVLWRTHKRTEDRRRQALAGEADLLADPQPVPNGQGLSIPTTLVLRLNMKFQLLVSGITLAIIFVCFAIGSLVAGGPKIFSHPVFLIIIGAVALFILAIFGVALLFARLLYNRVLKQEIILHEQGITTKYFGKSTTILWNEVQCFDIWGGKTKRMVPYELIGQNGVVRWIVPNRYRLFFPFKPTVSYEEYGQKIAALQQVVIAKTGKPLYDLRDKKIYWW